MIEPPARVTLLRAASLLAACASAALATGCGEPEPDVTPVVVTDRRPVVEDDPSPYVTNPHVNLRERSAAERAREQAAIEREAEGGAAGGGGGGGGGPSWDPEPADPPTSRELEQYRRELEQQTNARVDPEEDPCDQFRDLFNSTISAQRPEPGRPRPRLRSRSEVLSPCRDLPAGIQQCFDRAHFNAHRDECNELFERMGRRGARIRRRAERARDRASENDGFIPGAGGDEEEEDDLPVVPDAVMEGGEADEPE